MRAIVQAAAWHWSASFWPLRLGSTPVQCIPEIIRDEPGDCPICGMALEPVVVTEDEEDNSELIDMTRRFWVSLAFTVPVFLIAMGDLLPGQPVSAVLPTAVRPWIELLLASPVALWGAWPFFVRGWRSNRDASPQYVHVDRPGGRRRVRV